MTAKARIVTASMAVLLPLALAACTLLTDLSGLSGGAAADAASDTTPATTAEGGADGSGQPTNDASADASDEGQNGGVVVLVPTSTGAVQAVLGFPVDTPAMYFTYVADGAMPNDDTNYVRSRGGATTNQFVTLAYDKLIGKTAKSVDVTLRAKKSMSAVCTPSVALSAAGVTGSLTATGVPLVTDTWTTQTLHFALPTLLLEPAFSTEVDFNNDVGNSGQCLLTAISIAVTY